MANEVTQIGEYVLPPVCMAIVCCSMFIVAPKYMIIEPKSPQSLKTIYQVLKFVAEHKAPLNRSAFTYWEEDVPSRLDLGKSRYGGPFTTEQVEDVKTFFKILIVHLPLLIFLLALGTVGNNGALASPSLHDPCSSVLLDYFTLDFWWTSIITTVAYEFVLFPFAKFQTLSHV